jgi:nitrite reductase/ring-hydroxylating ferredoxin subunit
VNDSILVVRVAPDQIKAYYNACLHRGTALKIENGNVPCLRCPFHGWTWNLDGTIGHIPSMWDLPHVDQATMSLPEVAVDTWDGWVFVNMADEPPPLRSYLGPLVEHFEPFPLGGRFKALHVLAKLPCNWKLALEAFIESYHVWITHPEIAPYSCDEGTQYDILSEHVSRMITLEGLPSTQLAEPIGERAAAEAMISGFGLGDPAAVAAAPPGETGRDVVAAMMRTGFGAMHGVDLSATSNTELLDAIEYLLFPNFTPARRRRPRGGPDGHHAAGPAASGRPAAAVAAGARHQRRRGLERDPEHRRSRPGVRPGHRQPAPHAARPQDHPQTRGDADELPGVPHPPPCEHHRALHSRRSDAEPDTGRGLSR